MLATRLLPATSAYCARGLPMRGFSGIRIAKSCLPEWAEGLSSVTFLTLNWGSIADKVGQGLENLALARYPTLATLHYSKGIRQKIQLSRLQP